MLWFHLIEICRQEQMLPFEKSKLVQFSGYRWFLFQKLFLNSERRHYSQSNYIYNAFLLQFRNGIESLHVTSFLHWSHNWLSNIEPLANCFRAQDIYAGVLTHHNEISDHVGASSIAMWRACIGLQHVLLLV